MRTLILGLGVLAACAPPPRLPRTTRMPPPPLNWTGRDLRAPQGPAVLPLSADSARRHAGYPADSHVFSTGVALPPERYEAVRALRLTELPARRILAILPVLGTVPLRTGVWPGPARVVEHDTLGALIATEPVSLASLRAEVVCPSAVWPREVAVRLEAYVSTESGVVLVRPRMGVAGAAECRTGVVGRDRTTAFAADVAAALRQAARMGMPVPLRAGP
ncbi:MAG TPA: hypothetical protein VF613_17400 [Longimicrobium sp.]